MNIESSRQSYGRNRRKRSRLRSFVMLLQVVIFLGMGASVGVGMALFISLSQMLPKVGNYEAPEATIIYSSDNVILGRIFREDRTNVPLKDIPTNLRNATIAIEDERFYQHAGVDFRGIGRALWVNIRYHRAKEGGSTITQQLARNIFLSPDKTIRRKIQEAVLAILLERNFTKDKILELYLNRVFYGSGSFGVQAASRVYFGKDVGQLNLSECALLAGLPARPSGYSPHNDIKTALNRRDVVLNTMADLGYISPSERDSAKAERIRIVPPKRGRHAFKAQHFVDYVTNQLKERYGEDVLYGGGLRVYTTLNYKMQQIAEDALKRGVTSASYRRVGQGCFVAIEPQTGYIRAMVGSAKPGSEYNRCVQGQGRQPGSLFKAFVYTAALAKGMHPDDRILDAPVTYPSGTGKPWCPKNYDNRFHGWVTIRRAVAQSINIPAIKVADKIGIKNVIKYAQAMGITSEIEPYLPTAIGGVKGIHPLEICSAFGTFANKGFHVEPFSIVRVANNKGDTIEEFSPHGRQVIPEKVNVMMDELFRGVVTGPFGTGKKMRDVPGARGKTGTTSDDRDAWWIGYVPNKLVAACWIGNDDYKPMNDAWGGTVCGPIWREFMLKAIPIYDQIHTQRKPVVTAPQETKEEPKPSDSRREHTDTDQTASGQDQSGEQSQPDVSTSEDSDVISVRICDDSQLLATKHCPSTHVEKFLRGTEPTTYCTIHSDKGSTSGKQDRASAPSAEYSHITVCSDSGMIAGPYCPRPVRKRFRTDEMPTRVCTMHTHP